MSSREKFEARFEEIKPELMRIEGVVGIGVGEEKDSPYLVIMLKRDDERARAKIGSLAGDIPYRIKVTGEFRPFEVIDP